MIIVEHSFNPRKAYIAYRFHIPAYRSQCRAGLVESGRAWVGDGAFWGRVAQTHNESHNWYNWDDVCCDLYKAFWNMFLGTCLSKIYHTYSIKDYWVTLNRRAQVEMNLSPRWKTTVPVQNNKHFVWRLQTLVHIDRELFHGLRVGCVTLPPTHKCVWRPRQQGSLHIVQNIATMQWTIRNDFLSG